MLKLTDNQWVGSRLEGGIGRRELFFWVTLVLFANRFFRIEPPMPASLSDTLAALLTQNSVFHYIGWFAVFSLLRDASLRERSHWREIALALGLCVVNVSSTEAVVWISATAVSLYLWATCATDARIKAAAAVLFALSLNGLWGPLFFRIFSYPLLVADAALVGGTLAILHDGAGWQGTIVAGNSGHRILLYGPCSSFHNISLGLLCWVSLTMLARPNWVREDLTVASVVVGLVVLLNTARLYLMALSIEGYHYWHEGAGLQVYTWATTVCVLAIGLWGSLRGGKTP
jgi:hypothetical protein